MLRLFYNGQNIESFLHTFFLCLLETACYTPANKLFVRTVVSLVLWTHSSSFQIFIRAKIMMTISLSQERPYIHR